MKGSVLLNQTGLVAKFKGLVAVLYELVLGLGGPGLFFLALADSSFVSVPEGNDLLIVILSTGASWGTMLYYVTMTTLGSVTGCLLLYSVGRHGGPFVARRVSRNRLDRVRRVFNEWGMLAIVIPSLLPPPMPFKVFVLSAGIFGLPWTRFALAVAVGRSIRYAIWGVLAVLFGERAKMFMEQNLRTVGIVLALVLVLGTVLYVLWRWRWRAVIVGEDL